MKLKLTALFTGLLAIIFVLLPWLFVQLADWQKAFNQLISENLHQIQAHSSTCLLYTSIITVDGPSGAGKGTLCYALAEKLGFTLLDSGAIYRVTALAALKRHADLTDEEGLAELARHLDIQFIPKNGEVNVPVSYTHLAQIIDPFIILIFVV